MSYTQADFDRDLAKLRELSAGDKPDDLCAFMQWEMAWTHRALAIFLNQVYKASKTSAPTEDAENFLGYAQQWVRFLELHLKVEIEVIVPVLSKFTSFEKSHSEQAQIAGPLAAFSAYLAAVSSGAEGWSAAKAEERAQALFPIVMQHFVEQLDELDPRGAQEGRRYAGGAGGPERECRREGL
ncbi:hypothetical protein EVJ58_g4540 [Rhodofomes roseus]|uniref:Hemerythrin-like domain-containing protein n=1 Tax=Rhodofomes roseus TaxID=34475 RepID=A0A4Y9YKD2_9APHY|nr:hypothetical protein EVJ58_g4540 [Rhodofomes roseus]